MEQTTKVSSRRRKPDSAQQERRELLDGLEQTAVQLRQAYACFNLESDPDLIESYVFEIRALQSRYSYLLKRVREAEQPDIAPVMEV